MRGKIAILAVALTAVALVVVLTSGDGGGGNNELQQLQQRRAPHALSPIPGVPGIDVISPRNGARQTSRAVVVKVIVHNFHLAPRHFGEEPELREGNIRFSSTGCPTASRRKGCGRSLKSPIGSGHLVGASFDFPRYSGPNGILAERIGVAGSYSPATRPEIYYHDLPAGFYHLVVTLARNDGNPDPLPRRHQLPGPDRIGARRVRAVQKREDPSAKAPRAFE